MSIEALAEEGISRGYHSIAVTDHSQSQAQANGLSPQRLRKHIADVRKVNDKYSEITLLTGSEVDILPDGSLDYEDALLQELDVVVAPVGGGGLMSGSCITTRAMLPAATLVGAEPAGADDAARSLAAGELIPQTGPDTICDGLLTSLGDLTWPILRDHLQQIITVDDSAVVEAMRHGRTAQDAAASLVERVARVTPADPAMIQVGVLALGPDGSVGAFGLQPGFVYVVARPGSDPAPDAEGTVTNRQPIDGGVLFTVEAPSVL